MVAKIPMAMVFLIAAMRPVTEGLTMIDNDNDGLPDEWEIAEGLDLSYGAGRIPDRDGTTQPRRISTVIDPAVADESPAL